MSTADQVHEGFVHATSRRLLAAICDAGVFWVCALPGVAVGMDVLLTDLHYTYMGERIDPCLGPHSDVAAVGLLILGGAHCSRASWCSHGPHGPSLADSCPCSRFPDEGPGQRMRACL